MSQQYRQSIVAFLDLLGFRNLVKLSIDAGDETTLITNLEQALERSFEFWKRKRKDKEYPFELSMFSDCVCFSCPLPKKSKPDWLIEDILGSYFMAVCFAISEFIKIGVFVRGGITIGPHYQSARLIFSPSLIRAYDLESKFATYPRILVDMSVVDEVLPRFGENAYVVHDWFRRDSDGQYFFNHLPDEVANMTGRDLFRWNKRMIQKIALEFPNDTRIIEKCRWAASFHNLRLKEYWEIYRRERDKKTYNELEIDEYSLFPAIQPISNER